MNQQTLIEHSARFHADSIKLMKTIRGAGDKNLTLLSECYGVKIKMQDDYLHISGEVSKVQTAHLHIESLHNRAKSGTVLSAADFTTPLPAPVQKAGPNAFVAGYKMIEPRNDAQRVWAASLFSDTIAFGNGPAGTGKTWMAVAVGVAMLDRGLVDRLVLTRPVVEAGERLGFLPGDAKEKIDPYMQPLYDALIEFMGSKNMGARISKKEIEIAPLAFMRGRTLSRAFIILDEAQNATPMQMKMFLTRLGEGSFMAITGDPQQCDLPKDRITGVQQNGLQEALDILQDVPGIGITTFTNADQVRHPLIAKILDRYDKKDTV